MTRAEAHERAIKIWRTVERVEQFGDDWWVEVFGEFAFHRLDRHGHVVCHHVECMNAERRVDFPESERR